MAEQMQMRPMQAAMPDTDGDLPEPQYEDAVDRVMTAFAQAITADGMREPLLAAVQSPEAMANFAYDVLQALDEKSGATIPEEVLPAVAFEAVGTLAEVADAAGAEGDPEQMAAQATQIMLMRFLTEAGMDPQQVQEVMQSVDLGTVVPARAGVVGAAMRGDGYSDTQDRVLARGERDPDADEDD